MGSNTKNMKAVTVNKDSVNPMTQAITSSSSNRMIIANARTIRWAVR
jgi:hypothetical protein